jgi:hypothetical protein
VVVNQQSSQTLNFSIDTLMKFTTSQDTKIMAGRRPIRSGRSIRRESTTDVLVEHRLFLGGLMQASRGKIILIFL